MVKCDISTTKRAKIAKKVTLTGLIINLLLSIVKIVAAILGRSAAVMADAIHSISDVTSDFVLLICLHLSGKEEDEDHQYGHGKFETLATLVVAVALLSAGVLIFISGSKSIIKVLSGHPIKQPGVVALYAALLSIVVKELLYRYTAYHAKKIESDALLANGWHHRSDALSSIAVAIGVAGSIFLGPNWAILDSVTSLFVSLLIIRISYQLVKPAIGELMDEALPPEVVEKIEKLLKEHPQVLSYNNLRTRKVGQVHVVDVVIGLSRELTFEESHDVATEIEEKLEEFFNKNCIVMIHTEPL